MKNYKAIGKIGEGTFSEVMKMQSLRDGNYYACKQMKQHFESIEQVNSLREIQALRRLNPHPNILTLHEVVFDRKSGSLALMCELMDMNIYELIRGRRHPLSEKKIMHYMYQLCKSLDHMHRNGIFHRDVKPENILVKQDVLKLGDFGSCRSVYSKQPYTEYISTRWYRAPECLLTDGFYTYKMDLWSAGCVFYEIASLQPLFPGVNELDQISKIHDVIGTPCQKTLTKFKQSRAMSFDFPFKKGSGIPLLTTNLSPQCLSLLHAMVAYDPDERIAAHQALQHPYFQVQRAAETQTVANRRAFFPKYPTVPELPRHNWPFSKEGRKQVLSASLATDPLLTEHDLMAMCRCLFWTKASVVTPAYTLRLTPAGGAEKPQQPLATIGEHGRPRGSAWLAGIVLHSSWLDMAASLCSLSICLFTYPVASQHVVPFAEFCQLDSLGLVPKLYLNIHFLASCQ